RGRAGPAHQSADLEASGRNDSHPAEWPALCRHRVAHAARPQVGTATTGERAGAPMTLAVLLTLATLATPAAAVPDTAFLTYESGVLVGADWIQRRGGRLRTLSVLMQSAIRDASIELRADETVAASSTRVGNAGSDLAPPVERSFGDGVIYWS